MRTVYESTFISVGAAANESKADNFIITFGEGAPQDVAEYCFIHRTDFNDGSGFGVGAVMMIGDTLYPVTAVGAVARENLRALGHLTVRFDGAVMAEQPGTVHVAGAPPALIAPSQKFRILSH